MADVHLGRPSQHALADGCVQACELGRRFRFVALTTALLLSALSAQRAELGRCACEGYGS